MSRGGREVCDVVETAWRHGARFDAWTEFFSLDTWRAACAECGVDMEGIAKANTKRAGLHRGTTFRLA